MGACAAGVGFFILFAFSLDSRMIGKSELVMAAVVLPLVCVVGGVILARPRQWKGSSRRQ